MSGLPNTGSILLGWIGTILGSAAVITLLGITVRQFVPWRKISVDAEKDFRDGLVKRIENLEKQLADAATALNEARDQAQRDREAAVAKLDAERAQARHRINNLDQAFNALLLLLKKGVPVEEAVEAIEKMRAEHLKAEALESASMRGRLVEIASGKAGGK